MINAENSVNFKNKTLAWLAGGLAVVAGALALGGSEKANADSAKIITNLPESAHNEFEECSRLLGTAVHLSSKANFKLATAPNGKLRSARTTVLATRSVPEQGAANCDGDFDELFTFRVDSEGANTKRVHRIPEHFGPNDQHSVAKGGLSYKHSCAKGEGPVGLKIIWHSSYEEDGFVARDREALGSFILPCVVDQGIRKFKAGD